MRTHSPAEDVTVLASEILGLGHLPVNCFVLHAEQPVLVDTGMPADRAELLDALWSTVDPADLRWATSATACCTASARRCSTAR